MPLFTVTPNPSPQRGRRQLEYKVMITLNLPGVKIGPWTIIALYLLWEMFSRYGEVIFRM